MSFTKYKSNSYCVEGEHYSATNSIKGYGKGIKVSDRTLQAERLGDF